MYFILGVISNSNNFIKDDTEKNIEDNKPFLTLSSTLLMIQNKLQEKAHEYLLKAFNLRNEYFNMLFIKNVRKSHHNKRESFPADKYRPNG